MLPQSQGKTDGKWSEWGDWEPCSSSCGNGHHTQRRECLFDNPDCKGAPCSGSVTNVESCKGAHPNCRFLSPEKMLVHANLFININAFTFSGYKEVDDYMGTCKASAQAVSATQAGVWEDKCTAPGVAEWAYFGVFTGHCCYCCHKGWCSKSIDDVSFDLLRQSYFLCAFRGVVRTKPQHRLSSKFEEGICWR